MFSETFDASKQVSPTRPCKSGNPRGKCSGTSPGQPTPVDCGEFGDEALTITMPGRYVLRTDCDVGVLGGDAITIKASDVQLDLNGHTLTTDRDCWDVGIDAQGVDRLRIEGPGSIYGFGQGIRLDSVNDSRVEKVTFKGSCISDVIGFGSHDQFNENGTGNKGGYVGYYFAGVDNRYLNNTVSGLLYMAIVVPGGSTNNEVDGNTITSNGTGIWVMPGATANRFHGNTVLFNSSARFQGFDLVDFNPGCDRNVWDGNLFLTRNEPCIH
jgi:parallel beta-helix repeat protein